MEDIRYYVIDFISLSCIVANLFVQASDSYLVSLGCEVVNM